MYSLLQKILFQLEPEKSHTIALNSLKFLHLTRLTHLFPKVLSPVSIMNLKFPNPIGLAAGLDKNGDYIDALAALGFGFIEIGTVTPQSQAGNPKPRLFRLNDQQALVNRMGFNNKGVDYVLEKLKRKKFSGIVGVNIGKNRDTPNELAAEDYLHCFRKLAPYASYITINISSPNTARLRDLQQSETLISLLQKLKKAQAQQKSYIPLIVKISPDLTSEEIKNMSHIFLQEKIDGVIATNTTIQHKQEMGGLSGKPLAHHSTEIIKEFNKYLQNNIPIIGCGGISTAEDAKEKLNAGAQLLQIYTSLIYQGPKTIHQILTELAAKNSTTA
jgi:dihydroorotate dehydrogenase